MKRRATLTKVAAGLLLATGGFLAGRMTGPAVETRAGAGTNSATKLEGAGVAKPGTKASAPVSGAQAQKAGAPAAFPESPAECVAKLTKELKGAELKEALQAAAEYYAGKGLEAAKEFLINLPPGEVSRRALLTVVYALRYESGPELMAVLQENLSKLDRSHVEHGMKELLEVWLCRDFEAAARATCNLDGWKAREKADMLEAGVWMAIIDKKLEKNPDALLDLVPDSTVRTELAFAQLVMKMRMRANFAKVIEDFVSAPESVQINAAGKIPWEVPLLPDPGEAMNVLVGSDLPAVAKMRDRAFQNWAESDLTHALEWLQAQPAKETRDELIICGWKAMAKSDPKTTRTWVESLSDASQRAEILSKLE